MHSTYGDPRPDHIPFLQGWLVEGRMLGLGQQQHTHHLSVLSHYFLHRPLANYCIHGKEGGGVDGRRELVSTSESSCLSPVQEVPTTTPTPYRYVPAEFTYVVFSFISLLLLLALCVLTCLR